MLHLEPLWRVSFHLGCHFGTFRRKVHQGCYGCFKVLNPSAAYVEISNYHLEVTNFRIHWFMYKWARINPSVQSAASCILRSLFTPGSARGETCIASQGRSAKAYKNNLTKQEYIHLCAKDGHIKIFNCPRQLSSISHPPPWPWPVPPAPYSSSESPVP